MSDDCPVIDPQPALIGDRLRSLRPVPLSQDDATNLVISKITSELRNQYKELEATAKLDYNSYELVTGHDMQQLFTYQRMSGELKTRLHEQLLKVVPEIRLENLTFSYNSPSYYVTYMLGSIRVNW